MARGEARRPMAGFRGHTAEAWRLSTGDDLEGALRAAERLLQQAEERRRHEDNRLFAIGSILVGVGLSFIASFISLFRYANLALALSTVITAGLLLGLLRWLMVQRRRNPADQVLDLATQLSSMAGEVLLDVAERERWSFVRIEATKLRLAAFPLPEAPGIKRGHGRRARR